MTAFLWAWLGSTKQSIQSGGYKGYYSYIPFINVYFFIKTSSKPIFWFLFMFIPILNFIVFSLVILDHLERQDIHDTKTKVMMILFYPVLSRKVL